MADTISTGGFVYLDTTANGTATITLPTITTTTADTIILTPNANTNGDVIFTPSGVPKPEFGDCDSCEDCHRNFECLVGSLEKLALADKNTPKDKERFHLPCVDGGKTQLVRQEDVAWDFSGNTVTFTTTPATVTGTTFILQNPVTTVDIITTTSGSPITTTGTVTLPWAVSVGNTMSLTSTGTGWVNNGP